ncbi:DUF397 domain-containing protein [Streptomyces griseorubiginosus]|uniref:DUF397 domain-containing protein n=1 Tax=Streptomyces griseorubiginosus TaxID=67304 RepID=UPI001AD74536|nr:DUF397 domain-containing protein [Streptomyces griseorubiginosus]MBO4258699.1 DUF397 domain-containing protein [Streptomyces griseorubiginosus]
MTNRDDALRNTTWFTSSHSNDQGGQCVQAARITGAMAVRDSKNPHGPAFIFTTPAWTHFINSLTQN